MNINEEELKKIINEVCGIDPFWNLPVFDLVKKIIEFTKDHNFCIGDIVDKRYDTIDTGLNIKQSIYDDTIEICKRIQINLEEIPKDERLFDDPFTWIISKKNDNTKLLSNNINNLPHDNAKNEYKFYKNNDDNVIWWVNNHEVKGEMLFSFDKKKIYNLFRDYPYELSNEEKNIFDKENPYWADFFKDRK